MSRIRIVKGTITKTTGGDHNIFSNGNIVTTSSKRISEEGLQGISYGDPLPIPENPITKDNFDITFELDKDTQTVVPFGILDFKNNIENPFFSFKYILSKAPIDSLDFQILNQNDEVLYSMTSLKTVILKASKKIEIVSKAENPIEESLQTKTWDYNKIYNQYNLTEPDYTQIGEYIIHWDGFDSNEIYDSTVFNGKNLRAKITAVKGSKQKSITVDFSTQYSEVKWTDVKIDRKTKRIDVTLRVNLTDGGAKGLDCQTINANMYGTPARPFCDWDRIPASSISPSRPVIKTRTKSFQDLEKLAIEGLNYHWGRNSNHLEGKNVNINGDIFEIFINTLNTNISTMVTIDLIYNTNNDWGRSGNPGVLGRIYYNEGYLKYSNGWGFKNALNAELEYKHTSGHEIGHSILKAYGGIIYSWQHKGSSYLLPQDEKPVKGNETVRDFFKKDNMPDITGEYYPQKGEIDLMKYYNYELDKISGKIIPVSKIEERSIVTEKDILLLLWLTKLKLL